LFQHPDVLEAAATGIPYEDKGDRVKAFVVVKPGSQLTAEELLKFCQQNLAPYKVPKFVEFRDSIPKTIVGKPLRRLLRAEELKRAAGSREQIAV
jgi:long-chain acyl-CoA synthetase